MCEQPATGIGYRDPGLIHSAVLHGVEFNETYHYRIGDNLLMSRVYEMKMPPAPSAKVTLAVFGDMGHAISDMAHSWQDYGIASKFVMMKLEKDAKMNKYDALFHIGDIR